MSQGPKIYTIPLASAGTHETFVLVVNGIAVTVNSWNFSQDEHGNRVFYLEGITEWQLHFAAGYMVQVIR